MEANYQKANLSKIASNSKKFNDNERNMLRDVLTKYEFLFDGTIGNWKKKPVDIEIKLGEKPDHAKPYPVPLAHSVVLLKEVERLFHLGVFKRVNRSEWVDSTFIQPKNNGTVRFLSNFRKLNQRIRRKPLLIIKIQDMLLNLEGFTYTSYLDLNMGYYHIESSPGLKQLYAIVLPWVK